MAIQVVFDCDVCGKRRGRQAHPAIVSDSGTMYILDDEWRDLPEGWKIRYEPGGDMILACDGCTPPRPQ